MSGPDEKKETETETETKTSAGAHTVSGTRVLIIGLVIFAAFAGWAFWLKRSRATRYNQFAQCLASKQVKMYGLYWCTHCADQKRMFGSSFQYVPYIECGIKGSRQEAPECVQGHLKNFPTWDFSGVRHEGVLPLNDIAERSGCALPRF
ncbi:MAG: hypothetical protein ACRD2U_06010 [Terriglobales bacterium]